MTTDERWRKAQEYERDHWARLAEEIVAGHSDLGWYDWKARHVEELVRQVRPNGAWDAVLEVGSGPVGLVPFLTARRKCAVDPLMTFYNENASLTALRKTEVEYVTAGGEKLPYPEASFDLVVIDNVIDHTQSPVSVLREIHRVLRTDGLLYFSVNVRTRWGLQVRRVMELFEVDKGHPHSYTQASARALLADGGFEVRHQVLEDRDKAREKERQEGDFHSRAKLLLGVYDILFEIIAARGM